MRGISPMAMFGSQDGRRSVIIRLPKDPTRGRSRVGLGTRQSIQFAISGDRLELSLRRLRRRRRIAGPVLMFRASKSASLLRVFMGIPRSSDANRLNVASSMPVIFGIRYRLKPQFLIGRRIYSLNFVRLLAIHLSILLPVIMSRLQSAKVLKPRRAALGPKCPALNYLQHAVKLKECPPAPTAVLRLGGQMGCQSHRDWPWRNSLGHHVCPDRLVTVCLVGPWSISPCGYFLIQG